MAAHYEAAGNWHAAVLSLQSAAQFAAGRQSHRVAEDLFHDALRIAGNLAPHERVPIEHELRQVMTAAGGAAANRS
jgi:hypothetical protein